MAAVFVAGAPALAQKDPPLIAVLVPGYANTSNDRIAALRLGLRQAGLIEGVDCALALRFAENAYERLPTLALELAALKPRVIVASSAPAAVAVHQAAPDLPMVFTGFSADPIKAGLVESYARPGGNTTGNVFNAVGGEESLVQKRIGLFMQLVRNLKRLGFIGTETNMLAAAELKALRSAASLFGFEIVYHAIQGLDDVEGAIASGARDDVDAFYVSGEPLLYNGMVRVLALIAASGKPTVGTYPEWGRGGLLMSYSSDLADGYRHAGTYAAKILGGAKPSDLPVEQASKFTLVINARTAKQLGIDLPLTFVADEVIE